MSLRRVKITLLCEDSQHEAFARRFLQGMGWETREIRVEKSPGGAGSGEQWVRTRFPKELRAYRERTKKAASVLLVMMDADTFEVRSRITFLEQICREEQLDFRSEDESVAIIVPKRNIETWIHYLNGEKVNEVAAYPKMQKPRHCQSAVKKLLNFRTK